MVADAAAVAAPAAAAAGGVVWAASAMVRVMDCCKRAYSVPA